MSNINLISINDFEIQPPADVWGRIMAKLDSFDSSESRFSQLTDFQIAPPASIWLGIQNIINQTPAVAPIVAIGGANSTNKEEKPKGTVKTLYQKLLYVAAAASITIGAFVLYQTNNNSTQKEVAKISTNNASNPSAVNGNTPVTSDSLNDNNQSNANTGNAPLAANGSREQRFYVKKQPRSIKKATGDILPENTLNANTVFDIEDETKFFLTLASYTLPTTKNSNGKLVIKVDQHSSVYISPKMGIFMKTLYETSKRKKPTRKARKCFRTLKNWKRVVNESFVDQTFTNFTDPFVLSDFLNKYRRL